MNLDLPFVLRVDQFVVVSVVDLLGLKFEFFEDSGSSDLCISLSDLRYLITKLDALSGLLEL